MNDGLKVFLAVVEHNSFTRAAISLHMTQPAVSQQIRHLELELGVNLIDRNNRTMSLTRAGEIVALHATEMVQAESRMRRLINELSSEVSGPLHIGASYSIGEYMLPRVLADFCKKYPAVVPTIEIGNTQSISSQVAHRELDVGLVEGTYTPPQVEIETLDEDEMILVANPLHPLITNSQITPEDLEKECWIVREEGSGTREVTDGLLRQYDLTPIRTMTFSSTQAIKEAVKSGLGISVLSVWTLQAELKLGVLRQVPWSGVPVTRRLFLVTKPSNFQPYVVSTFVKFAKDHFSEKVRGL